MPSQLRGIETSEMYDPHDDLTSPLPTALSDAASTTIGFPGPPATDYSAETVRVSTAPPVGPGTVLRQRYVLERQMGRGGMGTVYRALDRNKQGLPTQNRYVAVKVLREEFTRRPDALHALRREAHQAQSLSHPGIVNVFDFDRDGDVYFITMELLEGELLSDLIKRTRPGKLTRQVAIGILRDLGSAVAYAHAHGVLHMDLKPGNVMITTQREVRVLDFGLAHPQVREPWISDHPAPFPAATPTYASCEQLDGAAADVRDDVFSFACVAYELLSGEHPFGRRSAREARDRGHRPGRVRGLTRRQWRTLRRGLAWARDDRPRSLVELLEGLELAPVPPAAAPRHRFGQPGVRPGASRWWLRIAVVGVLAVGASLAWVRFSPDAAQDSAPATRDVRVAQSSPREDQQAAHRGASHSASADAITADSLVTEEDLVPLDVAAALALMPAPTARIAPADPGRLAFDAATVMVSESDKVARLRVVRRGGADGTVSFVWRTIDDSAMADRDYAALGMVRETMGSGQTSTTLLIPLVSDPVKESTELFDVAIDEPTGGAGLGADTRVTVIIVDDD